ncbi:MAG TPA: PAS domain S-box protein [Balneolaceae bacterium]|nr:PAS domain S-box protein [Balneolaceae bacterium]
MNIFSKSKQFSFFEKEPMFLYNYYTFEIIDVNEAALERYGYSKKEFQKMYFTDLGNKIKPEELDGIDKEMFNPSAIWTHSDRDGNKFYVQLTSHLIHQKGNPVQFTIAHVVDSIIRDEKKSLALLPRIESVRAHIPMAMIEWDKNFNVRDWSDKAKEIFGWEFEEVRGKNLFDIGLLPAKNREFVEKQLSDFITKGKNYFSTESENKTKDGKTIYCNWHNAAIYDLDRNLISIYSLVEDITDKRVAEQKLKESIESYKVLFNSIQDAMYILDEDGRFLEVNQGAERMYGYPREKFIGSTPDFLAAPGKVDMNLTYRRMEDALNGGVQQFEWWGRKKNGEIFPKELQLNPGKYFGKPVVIAIARDITERKKAEQKIKESLKEKEILLAEIHHRVKNNLAVITGLLELQVQNTDNDEAKTVLRDSQLRINSMALIHEKLYESDNLSLIQFGKYIGELIDVIADSHITKEKPIEIDIESDPIEFTITQAIPCGLLMNEIVTNALKHAFEGRKSGKIVISLKKEGDVIQLVISDNGVGLPDNFEEMKVKSLGMTLIYTLASQLNADMNIESGEGTVYRLTFEVQEAKHVLS